MFRTLIAWCLLVSPVLAQDYWEQSPTSERPRYENLSQTIPHPFYHRDVTQANEMMIIESGAMALQARIDLIRRAQRTIEVEYFIYNTDLAGKILTRELVAAAKRGVRVRILVDRSLPIFQLDEFFAAPLLAAGIEVKYYNVTPMVRISTIQFRNHRKLLIVDDAEVITGGRNVGDDYYSLSTEFNFNDRDVHIKGPIVRVMRESFDKFFEHKISKAAKAPQFFETTGEAHAERERRREAFDKKVAEGLGFLEESSEELAARAQTQRIAEKVAAAKRWHVCRDTTFATDAPGANFFSRLSPNYDEKYRFLRKALYDKISEVDRAILISSPYMLHNRHSKDLLRYLQEKNVTVTIYTNSLASTDAIYVASNLYLDLFRWRRQGINIFLHDGSWTGLEEDLPAAIKNTKWGTHDKTHIYDASTHSELMIGTYNIDNRSSFYNTEMAVFCRGNTELVEEARSYILQQKLQGITVNDDGTATDRFGEKKSVYGTSRKGLLLMRLITLPSWLLKFLL